MDSIQACSREFGGIIPYLVTPMDSDGGINVAELQRLSRHLIEQGVHGLTPLGSTGECAYLSLSDRYLVVESVIDASDRRVPVVPGVSSMSVKGAIEQTRAFERMGADGIVLTLDSYFPLSSEEVKSYFLRVADATELPIIIYTNPNFQKVDLSTQLIAELSEHPGFVGLKDASSNTGRLLSLADRCRPGFGLYAASSHIAVSVMMLGGKGWFAGPACVLPRESALLFVLCQEKRWDDAMALQKVLWRFNEAFAAYNLAACIKAALELQGFEVGNPVEPQSPLPQRARDHIAQILADVQAYCQPLFSNFD